jgi:hypothetical protein
MSIFNHYYLESVLVPLVECLLLYACCVVVVKWLPMLQYARYFLRAYLTYVVLVMGTGTRFVTTTTGSTGSTWYM